VIEAQRGGVVELFEQCPRADATDGADDDRKCDQGQEVNELFHRLETHEITVPVSCFSPDSYLASGKLGSW